MRASRTRGRVIENMDGLHGVNPIAYNNLTNVVFSGVFSQLLLLKANLIMRYTMGHLIVRDSSILWRGS